MGKNTYLSIHFRAVLHSWAEHTQLGQDFFAARCLPVRDIKGNECTTTVAGFRSIDNAELQSQLSCPPNPTQNALRGQKLAQPGHSALLCKELLWASTKHYLSCLILHVMRHSSVGSIRSQHCWQRKTQRASLNWSRPCSRARNCSLCMSLKSSKMATLQQNALNLQCFEVD